MPELGPYGSVRGALSNGCLYRDWPQRGLSERVDDVPAGDGGADSSGLEAVIQLQ